MTTQLFLLGALAFSQLALAGPTSLFNIVESPAISNSPDARKCELMLGKLFAENRVHMEAGANIQIGYPADVFAQITSNEVLEHLRTIYISRDDHPLLSETVEFMRRDDQSLVYCIFEGKCQLVNGRKNNFISPRLSQRPAAGPWSFLSSIFRSKNSAKLEKDTMLIAGPQIFDSIGDWTKYWAIDFYTLVGKAAARDQLERWILANERAIAKGRDADRLFQTYARKHRGSYEIAPIFYHFFITARSAALNHFLYTLLDAKPTAGFEHAQLEQFAELAAIPIGMGLTYENVYQVGLDLRNEMLKTITENE